MKTTLEVPDLLFKRATSAAAQRGISLRDLVTEALREKLAPHEADKRPWMRSFAKLRSLREETARIDRLLTEEFRHLASEDSY